LIVCYFDKTENNEFVGVPRLSSQSTRISFFAKFVDDFASSENMNIKHIRPMLIL